MVLEWIMTDYTVGQLREICDTQLGHIKRLELDIDCLKTSLNEANKFVDAEANQKNKDAYWRNVFAASALQGLFSAGITCDYNANAVSVFQQSQAMIEESKKYD